jgi:preprotein translocase subunit SecY
MVIVTIAFVVFMERSLRKVTDPIPPPSSWHEDYGRPEFAFADQSKPSGRYPGHLCIVFAAIAKYHFSTFSGGSTSPVMSFILAYFGPGQPLYLLFTLQ